MLFRSFHPVLLWTIEELLKMDDGLPVHPSERILEKSFAVNVHDRFGGSKMRFMVDVWEKPQIILALIQDTYLYDAQRRPHARPPGREEWCPGIGSWVCTAIYMIAHRTHP